MRSIYFSARVFFAVILTLILNSPGFAGNDSRSVEMETITVTATKSEKNIDGVSASVVVVGQKQIEKMGKDYPPYYMLITTNLPHILDMLKKPEVFKLSKTQRQRLEEIKTETLDFIMKEMKIIKALEIKVRDNLFVKEQGRKGLKPLLDEIEKHRRIMTERHVD